MNLVEVAPATPAYAELRDWLAAADLATSDLTEGAPRYFMLPGEDGRAIAFAGVAGNGADRLLRSVVVAPEARKGGVGARLVTAIEAHARASGAERLWLLTQGAAAFFGRQGYVAAPRTDAPPVIATTAQFQGLCPASAALLCKTLA